jgi:hypothetical protein
MWTQGYRRENQNRSGMLVNAMRVGAAARASNMLAGKRVAIPYLWFRASVVLISRVRLVSFSRFENRLSVCR